MYNIPVLPGHGNALMHVLQPRPCWHCQSYLAKLHQTGSEELAYSDPWVQAGAFPVKLQLRIGIFDTFYFFHKYFHFLAHQRVSWETIVIICNFHVKNYMVKIFWHYGAFLASLTVLALVVLKETFAVIHFYHVL